VIIGREFDFEVAQRASALAEGAALDALDELQRTRLVTATAAPGMGRVDHALTAEVVRREMTEPRHRHLHRRAAAALEHLGRANDPAFIPVIATHLYDAGEIERAAPYAAQAADQAGRVAAWREAVIFFEWAVAGTRDRERKAALWRKLGRARLEAGQAAQAEQAFQEALALIAADGQRALIQLELAQSLLQQSRFGDAVQLAQTLLDRPTPDGLNRATAELLYGTALSVEGSDLQSADDHLARADALISTLGQAHPELCAQVRFERGSIAAQQGDLPRALEHYCQALAVADEITTPVSATLAHNNIAYHSLLCGDLNTAQTHINAGLRLAEARGLLSLRPYLLSTQAEIALHLEQIEAAEALLDEGLAIAVQLGMRERVAGLTANLGRVALRHRQPALAIHRLSTALAQADAIGTLHLAAQIRIWLAPLLPPAERRARLDEARAIASSGGRGLLLNQLNQLTGTT
jgi:tetratricopeptide (TPR) repeat protein